MCTDVYIFNVYLYIYMRILYKLLGQVKKGREDIRQAYMCVFMFVYIYVYICMYIYVYRCIYI
jgi:hypothetical protein